MQKVVLSVRLIYGLMWVVFGLNFFLHFLQNPAMSEAGMAFTGALFATGYMFPLVKVVEIVCGALLLSGRYVALALVLLAPILVGIVALHVFLNPEGIPMAVILLTMHVFLMAHYRSAYAGMLQAK